MSHAVTVFLFTFGLFIGMLLFLEVGRRIGIRRLQDDSGAAAEGIGTADGAVFAVLGLLIAFTFSGATTRFDARRQLIVEETNDIGTAYLRRDVLAADAQPALREAFRSYLDARIETYRRFPDVAAVRQSFATANELQRQIWRQAVDAVRADGALPAAPMLLLPALNADRHHDDPCHGDSDAPAARRLRDALRVGAHRLSARRLRHDRQQDPQSIPHLGSQWSSR